MGNLIKIVSLMYLLISFGGIFISIINRNIYPFLVSFSVMILIFISRMIFNFSNKEFLLILLCSYLFLMGEPFFLNLFNVFFIYDKILHFFIMFVIGVITAKRLTPLTNKKYFYLATFFIVLGIGTIWEIYEFLFDMVLGGTMQGVFDNNNYVVMNKLNDTMLDLIMGMLGGAFSLILSKIRFKKCS